jgi:hypothetical protein
MYLNQSGGQIDGNLHILEVIVNTEISKKSDIYIGTCE